MNERAFVSAAQVLRRLADMELEGLQFYEGLEAGSESPWVRDLAQALVKAELRPCRLELQMLALVVIQPCLELLKRCAHSASPSLIAPRV